MGTGQRPFQLLIIIGCLSLVGYGLAGFFFDFYSSSKDVGVFLGLWTALFALFTAGFWVLERAVEPAASKILVSIMAFAIVFRLVMLFAGLPESKWQAWRADVSGEEVAYERFLIYDHDVWRYLWDGHVSAQGQDPYTTTPAEWMARYEAGDLEAEALFADERWDDVYDYLGYRNYTTVYPPLSQAFFQLCHAIAPGSVWVMKLLIVLFDLAICWMLIWALRALGRSPHEVLLYAWNPLVIKEYAGSGHLDPLMISLMVFAFLAYLRQQHGLSMLSLGMAVLAKLSPVLLVPFFLRRTPFIYWPLAALPLVIGYGWYWQSLPVLWQGLSTFAEEWVFNPGPWLLFQWGSQVLGLPAKAANVIAGILLIAACGYAWIRDSGDAHSMACLGFGLLACLLLLSPAVMPWYLPWVLVFAVLAGDRSWLLLTFLALGSYLIYIDQQNRIWWLWLEYGLFFAFGAWLWFGRDKMKSYRLKAG